MMYLEKIKVNFCKNLVFMMCCGIFGMYLFPVSLVFIGFQSFPPD